MKALIAKLIGAREKIAQGRGRDDKEMPFLEHLEELRQTIMKIVLTLIVFMIGAFAFHKTLMEMIRRPIEAAGLGASIDLPQDVTKAQWRKVQTLSKTAVNLDPDFRNAFLNKALGEDEKALAIYVDALPIFNATLVLPADARAAFVKEALSSKDALRETVLKLVAENPDAKIGRQGNLIEMSALRPQEAFMLSLKVSLLAGVIAAFPLLLYFIAQFIFPGLTPKEKRAVIPAVAVGFILFLCGAAFAYYFVTPRVLSFFHGYAEEMGIDSDYRIGYYTSFVSQLVLIFGLSFELPVIVLTLVKLDLLGYQFMAKNRSYAIVIIFTAAAILTPTPDAPTLCLLAVPMVLLYEFCIWGAYFIDKKRKRLEAAEEAERAIHAQKRATAREVPVPGALPMGTVAHASDDAAPVSDDDVQRAFEANDALRENEDGEPEYEEGFGPEDHLSDDEPVDPYSNYSFHNGPYETNGKVSDNTESVDESAGTDHKDSEESTDSIERDDSDENDPPSSPQH